MLFPSLLVKFNGLIVPFNLNKSDGTEKHVTWTATLLKLPQTNLLQSLPCFSNPQAKD